MEGRPHWLCLSISGAALFFVGKQVTQRAEPIIISINQSACCRTLLQQPTFLHACTQPLWWSPVENSGCGSGKRQSVEQQLNECYTKTERFASSHWLRLWYPPDCVSAAESDDRRKHVSTGEEAILVAVGDQLF